jgi:uncharacterized protein YneF (UPF0154 family)
MVDNILIVIAGMILGGFTTVKLEDFYIGKKYSGRKLSDEDYKDVMRKISFIESFISVFVCVVVYLTIKNYFLYGVCLGAFVFSRKPGL